MIWDIVALDPKLFSLDAFGREAKMEQRRVRGHEREYESSGESLGESEGDSGRPIVDQQLAAMVDASSGSGWKRWQPWKPA